MLKADRARLIVDGALRLTSWRSVGRGDNQRQELVYTPTKEDHAKLIIAGATTHERVRDIRLIVPYPIYLPGFTRARPGWCDGVYYDPPPELVDIEPITCRETIIATLDDLIVDFPFKDEASRQNTIGLEFTPIVRPALEGNVPMHLVIASLERTGKTKLVEHALSGIILGEPTPVMQLSKKDEESDKRIIATLIAGGTILHLDNIRGFGDSPAFASLLTARKYTGRLLGVSQMVTLDNNAIIVGTGNNIQATGEIAKRSVPIILQPATDSPETRADFQHPICRAM